MLLGNARVVMIANALDVSRMGNMFRSPLKGCPTLYDFGAIGVGESCLERSIHRELTVPKRWPESVMFNFTT